MGNWQENQYYTRKGRTTRKTNCKEVLDSGGLTAWMSYGTVIAFKSTEGVIYVREIRSRFSVSTSRHFRWLQNYAFNQDPRWRIEGHFTDKEFWNLMEEHCYGVFVFLVRSS